MSKFKRLVCFLTAAVMILGSVSAAASVDASAAEIDIAASQTQDRTAYYSKNYKLTGNYVDDYLTVARAQLGRTTDQMNYSEAWCANFVNDCARLTGMPDNIIPYNYSLRAGCRYLYSYMLENCNAKKITNTADLEPGDLVFYYCPETDFYLHVGIVETPRVFYLEGNYSDQVRLLNFEYNYKCYADSKPNNDFKSGHVKRLYLRPNYGCKATPKKVSVNPDDYSKPTSLLIYDDMEMTYNNGAGWVQAILYQFGYITKDKITGAYDENTKKAVIRYQSGHGLAADGKVGNLTLTNMQEEWAKLKAPEYKYVVLDKTKYNYYDTINISTETINADSVKLILKKNGFESSRDGSSFSFSAEELGEGTYSAFFRLKNKYTTVDTNVVNFTIEFDAPKKPVLTVSDADFYNAAAFSWKGDPCAVSYTVSITNSSNGQTTEVKDIKDTFFSRRLPEGNYTASVSAVNKYAETKSDVCKFSVRGGDPLFLGNEFYAAVSADNKGVCADSNAVKAGSMNLLDSKWYFKKADNDTYVIKSCSNGLDLTLSSNKVVLKEENNDKTQHWYIGKNGSGYVLIPESDTSKVFCCTISAVVRVSEGGSSELIDIRMVDAIHNYTLTSYKAADSTHEGKAVYTCCITNETYEKTIPCKTGSETSDTPDKPEDTSIIIGDVNGDKAVTAEDALLVLRCTVGLDDLDVLSEICADINFDLEVNSADALEIERYSVDLACSANIGKKIVSE